MAVKQQEPRVLLFYTQRLIPVCDTVLSIIAKVDEDPRGHVCLPAVFSSL
jgi:hypothetical protein